MSALLDLMSQQLSGSTRQLSRQLGTDPDATASAISGALPMLMSALAKNAAHPDGAEALAGALARDHDGSVLEDVTGFLGRGATGTGDGILRHVLGDKRGPMENALGRMSGLDTQSVGRLLALLAPLVLGALGRAQRQQGLDPGALANLLAKEQRHAQRAAPDAMGLVGQLLDADHDGEFLDDLAEKGVGLLGKLLSGR